ncbi:MAG: hypothetical protein HYY30_04485 [Chloroflexi bacterium]|nr:hypothetical protein [Chloroflexota bacterium]
MKSRVWMMAIAGILFAGVIGGGIIGAPLATMPVRPSSTPTLRSGPFFTPTTVADVQATSTAVASRSAAAATATATARRTLDILAQFVQQVGKVQTDYASLTREIDNWKKCCEQSSSAQASIEKIRDFSSRKQALLEKLWAIEKPIVGGELQDLLAAAYAKDLEADSHAIAFLTTGDERESGRAWLLKEEFNRMHAEAFNFLTDLQGRLVLMGVKN